MNKRDYQKELEQIIKDFSDKSRVPRLLLHSCCAPCSSSVLEYLSEYFEITVYYYNPNIFPEAEHTMRVEEQEKLIRELSVKHPVHLIVGDYEPERFFEVIKGTEREPEGGARCERCFRLRLEETALIARKGEYDYFTTTLTTSPLKNAPLLNQIGAYYEEIYKVRHLPSDFKKKNGYKRSVELSLMHNLYRQNYCGCVYSREEASAREKEARGAVCLDT